MSDSSAIWGSVTRGEEVKNEYMEGVAERKANPTLDKEAFLNLLMAQLKYQDPLDPMDNTEMVAQLAQFSALEQMTNLASTMTNTSAYSLIGKYVYAVSYNESTYTSTEVEGYVDSVVMQNGEAKLVIGDNVVDYDDIQKVYDSAEDYTQTVNGNVVNSQAMSLVGKKIQALTVDSEGNVNDYVEGTVDYVTFLDETPVLHVGGKEVYLSDVMSVGSENMIIGNSVTYSGEDGEDTSGTVSDIEIIGDSVYLVVDGQQIKIADLSSVMTAFSLIGKTLNMGEIAGEITGVSVRDSVPYVQVGDNEVKYSTAASYAA